MYEQKFYHEVIEPTASLVKRAAENVCVAPKFSDVISLAKQAIIATHHFRESTLKKKVTDSIGAMSDPIAETLRQRLRDAADSAKHGLLTNPDRYTNFAAALAFEFDDGPKFRFMRTEIIATSTRWGAFEVADTIQAFLPYLMNESDIAIALKIPHITHPFLDSADLYLTPKSGFEIQSTNVRYYKRRSDGEFFLSDPPLHQLRILEVDERT